MECDSYCDPAKDREPDDLERVCVDLRCQIARADRLRERFHRIRCGYAFSAAQRDDRQSDENQPENDQNDGEGIKPITFW